LELSRKGGKPVFTRSFTREEKGDEIIGATKKSTLPTQSFAVNPQKKRQERNWEEAMRKGLLSLP